MKKVLLLTVVILIFSSLAVGQKMDQLAVFGGLGAMITPGENMERYGMGIPVYFGIEYPELFKLWILNLTVGLNFGYGAIPPTSDYDYDNLTFIPLTAYASYDFTWAVPMTWFFKLVKKEMPLQFVATVGTGLYLCDRGTNSAYTAGEDKANGFGFYGGARIAYKINPEMSVAFNLTGHEVVGMDEEFVGGTLDLGYFYVSFHYLLPFKFKSLFKK